MNSILLVQPVHIVAEVQLEQPRGHWTQLEAPSKYFPAGQVHELPVMVIDGDVAMHEVH